MRTHRLSMRLLGGVGLVAALALVACAERPAAEEEAPGALEPGDQLLLAATKVALPPEDLGRDDLPDPDSRGAELMTQYCATCHGLPSPALHSSTDWPSVARRMWLRMDRIPDRFGIASPTHADRMVLLEYLLDNALVVNRAELPDGPGKELFAQTCSQCHDLPDPRQHSPEDWVAVVRRMTERMETMLGARPSQDTYQRIVLYLENVSQAGGP